MSRKLSLIPLVLIVLVGAVWASSLIIPDKPGFPANPETPGTLGYALTFFGSDGTAPDALMLSGRTATGYIERSAANCTLPGAVWRGFQTDGTVLCETIGPLLAIGRFSEIYGTMEVSSDGGATWTPANTTDTLYEGYLVKSDASGTGTIDFDADDSIIRMDTSTLVQLEIGDLGGNSVAQAIVNDGRLWGRILTSTGINLGGGGLIAGVRGTSVSVEKNLAGQYKIYIIDSRTPTMTAKLSKKGDPSSIYINALSETPSFLGGSVTSIYSLMSFIVPKIKKDYLASQWIRENTKRDLIYMDTLAATNPLAAEEVNITEPANIEESQAMCNSTEKLWNTFSNECKGILHYTDFTTTSPTNYFKDTSGVNTIPFVGGSYGWTSGIGYTLSGITSGFKHHLEYNVTMYASTLIGKTITIELNAPIGTDKPTPGAPYRWYVGVSGSNGNDKIFVLKNKECSTGNYTLKNPLCNEVGETLIDDTTTMKLISFKLKNIPTQFIIGNSATGANNQIGATIKKIYITN